MNSERRIARDTVLNIAGQGLPLCVGALTIPPTIQALGPGRFGVLALAWVVLGYSNAFDLGLGRAATKFVAEAIEMRGDISSVVGTTMGAQAVLGVLASVVCFVFGPVVVGLLNIPPDGIEEARGALLVVGLAAPFLLVSSSLRGTLEAARRFDLVNAARAPLGALYFIVPLVGARAGWELWLIMLSISLAQAGGAVAQYAMCIVVFPDLRRLRFEFRMLGRLMSFGGWVAVSGFVGPVLVYVDRFAIGALMTVDAVGGYAAPHELIARLGILPVALVSALFPVFSGRRLGDDFAALASRSVRWLAFVMTPVVLIIIAFGPGIVRAWLGDGYTEIVTPLRILAFGALVNALAHVPYTLLQGVGRPDIPAKLHLLELPLHLVLVWVFVDAFGLVGAATAWSIRSTVDCMLLFAVARRMRVLADRRARQVEARADQPAGAADTAGSNGKTRWPR